MACTHFFSRRYLLLAFLFVLLCFACARDYVTGKRTFSLISESDEIAMGREADPAIVAEFGLYEDAKLAALVDSIGQAIARVSHRPNLQYTFRVVDSPVVNAFALPGGFVYFTRGILAHFNSEAELAGVMGHEVGHITARHGAEQQSKAGLANLGLGVGSIFLPQELSFLGDLAQAGVGLLFLKFSRDQESESDRLGVEYSTRIGYDAHHMSRFFRTISRITEQAGGGPPTFLSTHPNPENREHTVAQLANEWQQKIPGPKGGTSRSAYLRKIEGLVYGEDPRQGFVEGGYFYHPELRFQFVVPAKWQVANQPTRVVMVNPEQNAAIQFSLGKGTNPQQAAETFVSQAKATVLQNQAIRVNNMPAYMLVTNVQSQQGVLRLLSYFIQKEDKIYVFHGYTSSSLFDRVAPTFEQVMKSFDQLRNQAALNKQPQRVRILQVNQPGDLRQTLKSFGVKEEDLEELAILNGMLLEDKLQRGDVVKVVR